MQSAAQLTAAPGRPNYSPDPTLTPAHHHVLNLLAGGATITEAAAAAGIHRNTIGNWRRSVPAFARELEFAAREQAQYWHDQASQLAPQALDVISAILHNSDAAASLRLRAALAILKIATDPTGLHKPALMAVAEMEASHGELLSFQQQSPTNVHAAPNEKPAQFRTMPAAVKRIGGAVQPIRKAPEPARNSLCPCCSGLKYKRCCANRPNPPFAK